MKKNTRVIHRYASVLAALAYENGVADQVLKNLKDIDELLKSDHSWGSLLSNPTISRVQLENALMTILKKLDCHRLVVGFFVTLSQARRLNLLFSISPVFEGCLAVLSGKGTLEIESAYALSKAQIQEIVDIFSVQMGRDFSIQTAINSDLIAGFRAQAGGYLIDASVQSQLQQLRQTLKGAL